MDLYFCVLIIKIILIEVGLSQEPIEDLPYPIEDDQGLRTAFRSPFNPTIEMPIKHPYLALIAKESFANGRYFMSFCTGTFITQRTVITAGSCIINKNPSRPPRVKVIILHSNNTHAWLHKEIAVNYIVNYYRGPSDFVNTFDLAILRLNESLKILCKSGNFDDVDTYILRLPTADQKKLNEIPLLNRPLCFFTGFYDDGTYRGMNNSYILKIHQMRFRIQRSYFREDSNHIYHPFRNFFYGPTFGFEATIGGPLVCSFNSTMDNYLMGILFDVNADETVTYPFRLFDKPIRTFFAFMDIQKLLTFLNDELKNLTIFDEYVNDTKKCS